MTSGFILVCIIYFVLLWPRIATKITSTPIYSLVDDLEPLLETQRLVINELEKIIDERKNRLYFLKSEINRFEKEQKKMMKNTTDALRNHIIRFTLFKRLSRDFGYIKNQINEQKSKCLNKNRSLKYPTYRDFDEAGRMVLRLQRTYLFNVTQLADGLLNTTFSGTREPYAEMFLPMTTSDCFELSKVINKSKFYKNGIAWLFEALRLFAVQKPKLGLSKADIIEAICNTYAKLNNTVKNLKWAKKLARLKPNYDKEIIKELETRVDIERLGFDRMKKKKQKQQANNNQEIQEKRELDKIEATERKVFRMLCRGELTVRRDVLKRLKCWYFPGHHPFTRLAPFRAEQLFLQPQVLLLHNAVSDTEIQTLIHIARSKIKENPVQTFTERKSMYINLSKGRSFNEEESRSVEPLTQRISDITGYMATSQPLVVSNYGVGGHYIPHTDGLGWMEKDDLMKKLESMFYKKEVINELREKNIDLIMSKMNKRYTIATVLLYLSDVEQGGFTVFPWLSLAVPPIKGAALVWTNVLPSGQSNSWLMHGACPVLRGSKWVATKWINGTGQELQKPCARKNTSRKSVSALQKRHMHYLLNQLKDL